MALNLKRKRFVQEYLKDSNATQAAIRAGYSKRSAYAQGSALLKDREVSAAINTRVARKGMSADEVLEGLASIAKGAEKDSDKVSALGLLGKYHKLFTEKHEHAGEGGGAIKIAINGIVRA